MGPAAAAAENAALYLAATVRPEDAQTDANAALGKVLDTDDPAAKVVSLIDQQGKQEVPEQRFSYAEDIEPWLGRTSAPSSRAWATSRRAPRWSRRPIRRRLFAFARKVAGATDASPQPEEYDDATYQADPDEPGRVFGIVGDFLVQGSLEGFKAAVDAEAATRWATPTTSRTRSTTCPTIAWGPSTRCRGP